MTKFQSTPIASRVPVGGAVVFVAAAAAGALSVLVTAGGAAAVPVSPGVDSVHLTGTTLAATPELAGDIVARQSSPFRVNDFATGATLFDGTLESRVIREAASQKLAFHYRLITNAGATAAGGAGGGELFRFTTFGFRPGIATDVGYLSDTPGDAGPSWGSRTDSAVDFRFAGESTLAPGEDSLTFYVRTNATTFDDGGFTVLDVLSSDPAVESTGQVRSTLVRDMFQPLSIPLPAAVWGGTIGVAAVALLRRRFRA